jgi:hypothetical protein
VGKRWRGGDEHGGGGGGEEVEKTMEVVVAVKRWR